MIDDIAKRAVYVKTEHDALEAAKADKQAAKVELLKAVINAVRPALTGLCSRIQHIPGPALRGLNVANCLYLTEMGTWIELREGGSLVIRVNDENVARRHVVEDIVQVISSALTKQIGARDWATSEIKVEAERLRAAALLLSPAPPSKGTTRRP